MIIGSILTIVTLLIATCLSQDALISPKVPFTITLNSTQSTSESYLIELSQADYKQDWTAMAAHYHGKSPQTILDIQFTVVFKEDPTKTYQKLNKCRFEGQNLQWCKIGNKAPPLNLHNHLLKVDIDLPQESRVDIVVGLTETKWEEQANPRFLSGPVAGPSQYATTKVMALVKILGWMLLTLLLVLGAIQFAVKVADHFDKKPEKKPEKKPKGGHQKRE